MGHPRMMAARYRALSPVEAELVRQVASAVPCSSTDALLALTEKGGNADSACGLLREKQQQKLSPGERDAVSKLAKATACSFGQVLEATVRSDGNRDVAIRLLKPVVNASGVPRPPAMPPGGSLFGAQAEQWEQQWRHYYNSEPQRQHTEPFGVPASKPDQSSFWVKQWQGIVDGSVPQLELGGAFQEVNLQRDWLNREELVYQKLPGYHPLHAHTT